VLELPGGRRLAYAVMGDPAGTPVPWDIDLADVAVPAQIWHGTADRNVPVAHARVIAARCPAARLHIVEGGGHLLLSHVDEILASLAP